MIRCRDSYQCLQGCHEPAIPVGLSAEAAKQAGFRGLVIHSSEVASRFDDALAAAKPLSNASAGTVLVVGGGKSAQECVHLLAAMKRNNSIELCFAAFQPPLRVETGKFRLFLRRQTLSLRQHPLCLISSARAGDFSFPAEIY